MEPFETAIIEHATKDAPNECCGVITRSLSGLCALPLVNVSPEPKNSFMMDVGAYKPYLEDGTLVEYYHSHVTETEELSESDKKLSESCGYPVRVYSLATGKFARYVPTGYVTPLVGRSFSLGAHDCFGLVEDYYSTILGIKLTPFPRAIADVTKGRQNFRDMMVERDLVEVKDLRVHDILCFGIRCEPNCCNHLAVLVEPGIMLHQLINMPSRRVVYGGHWLRQLVGIARHKTML